MPVVNLSETKRRRILEEATTLFLKEGYSAASMSELLRRVGGSKTTIYTHFGDKTGLDERVAEGELVIDDTARATDVFFGTLLHRSSFGFGKIIFLFHNGDEG